MGQDSHLNKSADRGARRALQPLRYNLTDEDTWQGIGGDGFGLYEG